MNMTIAETPNLLPHGAHGLSVGYYAIIIGGGVIVLLAIVSTCIYYYKKRQSANSYKQMGRKTTTSAGRPLLHDEEKGNKTHYAPSKSKKVSKQNSLVIGSPPGGNQYESMRVQPMHDEFSQSYESLNSSSSSVQEEMEVPDAPTDRGGEELGSIYFNLSYDRRESILKLCIQRAVNLLAKDISGTSDPFVKILLLPDKKNKLETRIKRKICNPVWNEVFTFEEVPEAQLIGRTLYLQVVDYDRFSRNDPIGEAELELADIHLQQEPVPFVKKLTPCKRPADYYGDLLISMCYNPYNASRITIVIMKCANLKLMDITRSCDPYVKIYLVYDGKRIEKRKSTVKRRSPNAIWNESFEFEVTADKMRELSFVLTVTDYDRVLPNEAIGQVVIGYRTTGTSLKHWTDMMDHPKKTIAMWHKIKEVSKEKTAF